MGRWKRSVGTAVCVKITCAAAALALGVACGRAAPSPHLVPNGSFEETVAPPSKGTPFRSWTATVYSGTPNTEVGRVARHGDSSCLLVGSDNSRIRVFSEEISLKAGLYRLTAWIRGMDLSATSQEAALDFGLGDRQFPLKTSKTFGWRQLEHFFEIKSTVGRTRVSFGLTGPGLTWLDDVRLSLAPGVDLVPAEPRLKEAAEPFPSEQQSTSALVECPVCGFRNVIGKKSCIACGSSLDNISTTPPERVRRLVTFEGDNPFGPGAELVKKDALSENYSLKVVGNWTRWPCRLDWTGFDWFEFDVFVPGTISVELEIAIEDSMSTDYRSRFNDRLFFPPGHSYHAVPIAQMRAGDRFFMSRPLDSAEIREIAYRVTRLEPGPVIIDNLRLTQTGVAGRYRPTQMRAFDFGPPNSVVTSGFDQATSDDLLPAAPGGGSEEPPRVHGSFDEMTFDPLGRDYVCIESGRFGVAIPNGTYILELTQTLSPRADRSAVFGGTRRLRAEDELLVEEREEPKLRTEAAVEEDLAIDNLWEKYQRLFLRRYVFEVVVSDGRLDIAFEGSGCSWAVAGIVVYPKRLNRQTSLYRTRLSEQRKRLLETRYRPADRRRSESDPGFARRDRLLTDRDVVVFSRPVSKAVPPDYLPEPSEISEVISTKALAGEYQPVTFSVLTGRDLGSLSVSAAALSGPRKLPGGLVEVGYVTHRYRAAAPDGSVYRIGEGDLIPKAVIPLVPGRARRIVLSVSVPEYTRPGRYESEILLTSERGGLSKKIILRLDVLSGLAAPLDVGIGPRLESVWFFENGRHSLGELKDSFIAETIETLSLRGYSGLAGIPGPRIFVGRGGTFQVEPRGGDDWLAVRRNHEQLSWLVSEPVALPVPKDPDDVGLGSYLHAILEETMAAAKRKNRPKLLMWVAPHRKEIRRLKNLLNALDEAGSSDGLGWAVMCPYPNNSSTDCAWDIHSGIDVVLFRDALDYLALPQDRRPKRWGIIGTRSSSLFGIEAFYLSRRLGLVCSFGDYWAAIETKRIVEPAETVAPWASLGPRGDIVLSYEFAVVTQQKLGDLRRLITLEGLIERTGDRAGKAILLEWMKAAKIALWDQVEGTAWFDWHDLRERTLAAIDKIARKL